MDEFDLEVINGTVTAVLYSNEENGYTVLKLGDATVTGCIPDAVPGEKIVGEGRWITHPNYGKQFKAEYVSRFMPEDSESIFEYLRSGVIKGIGDATASQIVNLFGAQSLDILEAHPERLTEIRGITAAKANRFSEEFRRKTAVKRLMEFICGYGIRPVIALRLNKQYGEDAVLLVKENPYLITAPKIGGTFAEADAMALDMGFESDSRCRVKAGVIFEMMHNLNNGHCFIPYEPLCSATAKLIRTDYEVCTACVDELAEQGEIIIENINGLRACYLPDLYEAETYIAERLSQMRDRLEIITGGPGTGKTTSIIRILEQSDAMGLKTLLTAPTGRAAKRMSEVTKHDATTVHRLLGAAFDDDGQRVVFSVNESHPLECDLVILDECSMVDVPLFAALLRALPERAKLVLVGDCNQLPPVGPGFVFSQIISSELFHTVRLTKIYRQSENSNIVKNAHLINEGVHPDFSQNTGDFFRLKRLEAASGVETVTELFSVRLPQRMHLNPDDIQVISPTRRGELGTVNLNRKLQEILNPPAEGKKEKLFGEVTFREGDRVMQIRNDYDILWHTSDFTSAGSGMFNGDVGTVSSIDFINETMEVNFDGKIATYSFMNLNELEHAWAMTVHKSQGCEFKAVILVLSDSSQFLLTRDVLYTAVTRARELLIIVGSDITANRMIDNFKQTKRFSYLKYRLKELCASST